jgi:hypothetical protein
VGSRLRWRCHIRGRPHVEESRLICRRPHVLSNDPAHLTSDRHKRPCHNNVVAVEWVTGEHPECLPYYGFHRC